MAHDFRIKNLLIEECFQLISNFIAFLRKKIEEKDTYGTKKAKIWKESAVNKKALGLGKCTTYRYNFVINFGTRLD